MLKERGWFKSDIDGHSIFQQSLFFGKKPEKHGKYRQDVDWSEKAVRQGL